MAGGNGVLGRLLEQHRALCPLRVCPLLMLTMVSIQQSCVLIHQPHTSCLHTMSALTAGDGHGDYKLRREGCPCKS